VAEDRGVAIQVPGRKVVGAVHDKVIGGEQGEGIACGDALGMLDDPDVRVGGPQPGGCRRHLGLADGRPVVKHLALQVVLLYPVEIGDPKGSHAGRRQVERCRAAESAHAHHQHPRRGELLLAPDAYRAELEVAAVSCEFLLGEHRVRKVFALFPGFANWQGAENVNILLIPVRFLGIDYGTKRVGVAFGDDLGIATPLPALVSGDSEQRWHALAVLVRDRRVTDLVLGYPFNMDGSAGPKAREVDGFARRLTAAFGLPVHLVDERLTSYEAEATVERKKLRGLRSSGIIDSRAATLILQDFLDRKSPCEGPGLL